MKWRKQTAPALCLLGIKQGEMDGRKVSDHSDGVTLVPVLFC